MSPAPEGEEFLEWMDRVLQEYRDTFGRQVPTEYYGALEEALEEAEAAIEEGEPLTPPEAPEDVER